MSMADSSIAKSIDHTFLKEVDRSSTIHSSGMSILHERTSKNETSLFNKSMHHKTSAMTSRKRTYDHVGASGSSNRNSLYDTYHKIQTLKAGIKPNVNQKPSIRNFPSVKSNKNSVGY